MTVAQAEVEPYRNPDASRLGPADFYTSPRHSNQYCSTPQLTNQATFRMAARVKMMGDSEVRHTMSYFILRLRPAWRVLTCRVSTHAQVIDEKKRVQVKGEGGSSYLKFVSAHLVRPPHAHVACWLEGRRGRHKYSGGESRPRLGNAVPSSEASSHVRRRRGSDTGRCTRTAGGHVEEGRGQEAGAAEERGGQETSSAKESKDQAERGHGAAPRHAARASAPHRVRHPGPVFHH
ncbi:hypothetical protein HYPSUDRAFT_685235 [Hypholoma sublateritium FD-334 SS-4]|uniref:Uncharacterized protein n=1 Tax=Hypholoma sublateritium (strain FD-334 SS-4) TaxID=945553 RepID=A0A0D2NYU0_HYPSF|nr:hypothetical protein HYPSUDRAFT_685235 [Hypholoma sublateritium FD-334 SS-4]